MPRRRRGTGPNASTGADEVVDAVHRLDDDPDVAQVVAPHVLEQLGVVAPLDPDPARRGHRAGPAGPATEPDAVVDGRGAAAATAPAGAASPAGPRAGTRPASTRSGAGGCHGRAASTASNDHVTTSPQNPLARSSTTIPRATSTSG